MLRICSLRAANLLVRQAHPSRPVSGLGGRVRVPPRGCSSSVCVLPRTLPCMLQRPQGAGLASSRCAVAAAAVADGEGATSKPSTSAVAIKSQAQFLNPDAKHYTVRAITKDDVEMSFARSSGAGGQNVNKVNTKVDMRLDIGNATWIPQPVRAEMMRAEKNRVSNDGWLVVSSQKNRLQSQNIDDALEKLQAMIDNAVEALAPKEVNQETIKKVKKKIKEGNERRLKEKKKSSDKKKDRRNSNWD